MRSPTDKLEMETVGALTVQPPLDVEIVWPGTRVPEIVGKAVFSGGLETRDLGSPGRSSLQRTRQQGSYNYEGTARRH
jgi:hypothetical protein